MKYILSLLLLSCSSIAFSQEKTTIEESLTYFKDGVIFEHKPTHFKTKFRFRIQNRFTYETEDTEDLSAKVANFEVRRARIRLEGNVFDPRLIYKIQLSFTRGDMDFDRTQYPNILRDAAVGWKFSDNTIFWYGQTKLPGNRQRVISSGEQQFVDRSLVNATFNLDRDIGAQLYHQIGDSKPLWIKAAITNGDGRGTNNPDNGLAYTGRIEWLPLGQFTEECDYFEADLIREPEPKFSIGGVYSMNRNAIRPGGQLGTQYTTEDLTTDIQTWFADALFKYRGISWSAEYANRWTPDAVFLDGTKEVVIYKGQGFNTQLGYIFENNIEPSVRYSKIWGEKETLEAANDQDQYTVALSKYINKHRVKLQTDLTYNEQFNHVSNFYSSNWIYRLQFELGI